MAYGLALALGLALGAAAVNVQQAHDIKQLQGRLVELEAEPRPTPVRADRTRIPSQIPPRIPPRDERREQEPRERRSVRGDSAAPALTDVTCYVATGNRTASGVWPRPGMAASNRHPFGTRLRVEGFGVVTVTDRIGHSSELDLFFADRAACLRFGRQQLRVEVVR